MRNEANHILPCLESLLQDPAANLAEILVYDAGSDDGSHGLVAELSERVSLIELLPNPRRLQAAAFNDALRRARGRYFLRADAHSVYPPNYISESTRLLETVGADNVGGIQVATGTTWFGRAVAAAVTSRFGVGDAQYRYASEPCFTDTVYLGCWRTERLRELGGMREDWAVNEDYELNVRLRQSGGRVYLSPTIRSTYFVRSSLPRLIKQYFRYGFWKVRTLRAHPGSLRWRQLVAPVFVLSLLAIPLLVHWFGVWGFAHIAAYFLADIAASAIAARRELSLAIALPVIFLVIHLSWGIGFLAGWVWWPWHD